MNDTNPKIEELHRKLLMEKTGEERVKMGFSMFQFVVALIADSLKNRKISTGNLQKEVFTRIYGDEFNNQFLHKVLEKRHTIKSSRKKQNTNYTNLTNSTNKK